MMMYSIGLIVVVVYTAMFVIGDTESFRIDKVNADSDTVNWDLIQQTNCIQSLGILVVCIDRSMVVSYC